MKKTLIAAAGATIAAAAMPVVGVFAAGSYTDTVQVTVVKSCVFKATWTDSGQQQEGDISAAGRTFSKDNVAPGTLLHFGGDNDDSDDGAPGSSAAKPIIKMECNEGSGSSSGSGSGTWTVSAKGGQASGKENMMVASGSGTDIATGTATSGETSNWAFKITASAGTVATGYGSWHEIPGSTPVNVLSGTATAGTDVTFTPEYQVYIGTAAKADTYTGKVVYTLSSAFAD